MDMQVTEVSNGNAKKAPTEYTKVTMEDGREVQFAGKRTMSRSYTIENGVVKATFDFVSGKTLSLSSADIPTETVYTLLGHGIVQKVGDESAGVKSIDDAVLATESMIARLKAGEFAKAREAGDSFAGASVVIRAICEVTGKDVGAVKAFLDGKLEAAKAAGQKLSRAALYASFRNPNSKTGAVIERLEREERAKSSAANADELLGEIEGA